MKNIIPLITQLLKFITPNEDARKIRLDKKALRLELKKLRIAKRMYRQIRKEFKKDGFTEEESRMLIDLKSKINQRKIDLIKEK